MNRLSQTILPLALGIGLAGALELPAIASPRYSYQQYNRSGVVIISPSRYRDYDRYDRYDRGYRRYRGRRYRYDDCDRRYSRVGRRRRHSRYRDSYRYRDYRGNHIRVIRYR